MAPQHPVMAKECRQRLGPRKHPGRGRATHIHEHDLGSLVEDSWSWVKEAREWQEKEQLYDCQHIVMVRYGIQQSRLSTLWLARQHSEAQTLYTTDNGVTIEV